jgi:hypothetical protein
MQSFPHRQSNDDASRKNDGKTGFFETAEQEVGKCYPASGAGRQLLSGEIKCGGICRVCIFNKMKSLE